MNQAEEIIQSLKSVFEIATTGFDEFKRDAKEIASGDNSTAASSGYNSTAASSGDNSTAASSGNYSKAASSGNYSKAASSGNYSKAASSGYYSTAASSGYNSTAASSGYNSTAASSGDRSKAAASGENVCAFACGKNVMAKASLGGGIALSEYDNNGKLVSVAAAIIDGKKLLADEWYKLEGGKFVHVDLTDDVFSRVVSIKRTKNATIKRVILDGETDITYLYIAGRKAAHGKTIEAAKEDLRYKIADRDTSKYADWKLSDEKPLDDIIEAYRVITGSCATGTKHFVESQKELPEKMTIGAVINATRGAFGNTEFEAFFKDRA